MLPLSDHEKRWGWTILSVFLLCLTLPYLWAWAITPQGFTWGGLLFSTDDQNVHLMWARQAQHGAFFVRDLFTTEGLVENTRPLFFNGLMLGIGALSRISGLEVVFWYHIVRVAGAAWALWQLHLLSWEITGGAPERAGARLATLALAAFTTGIGFLASAVPSLMQQIAFLDRADNVIGWPLMPEAFFYLSALIYPLNIVSLGLFLFAMRQILAGKWWLAALGALLLSNFHTYDALPLCSIALVWAAWQWKGERAQSVRALSALGGALLPIIYQVVVFRDSREFRIKALTETLPPPLWQTLISFAPLIVLAIAGWFALRDRQRERNFLALWALATLAMIYLPGHAISFARKMFEGWQLPLLLLAGVGLSALKRPLAMIAVVAVLALSPLVTTGWVLANAAENNASRARFYMPPIYLHDSEVEALNFIDKQPEQGAVLCFPFVGGYVPRATGKFTYAGHWAETLHMKTEKLPATTRYFRGQTTADEARQWFAANQIRWILEGPFERAIGGGSAAQKLGLKPLFSAGTGENQTVVYAAR